ncbi:YhjD/YihY/BrkB family envelope integrity protein [Actinoplanes sp. NEAU-A12]|uniref:YhjD/YihY/BrkB family envelope integrity protein n=1 Tax=Actinoplanes sandaracinus TaxID=3045177 RepID=A0ABT6WZS6_9ACTN|nr:YihY/virulence factor BrkB family protein [Actinoplanes sandaracinus]MDI6105248.1 YhjD/YihY/BrkB family envelope integrity protein [Actinoplanes sandaracinus]
MADLLGEGVAAIVSVPAAGRAHPRRMMPPVVPAADHGGVTEPDRDLAAGRMLAAVPLRFRARAAAVLRNRAGGVLLHILGELGRVQIFDRSMTLAAQAFTSVFPLLIMLGALLGGRAGEHLDDLVRLPDASARLMGEALSGSRSNAFGLAGCLIVILSATGLARALVRAYRMVWRVPGRRAGAASTGWQIGTVLLLAGFLIAARLLSGLTGTMPAPRIGAVVLAGLADIALAVLLPRILLGPVVPWRRLLPAGATFALIMVGVRAAGTIYLPRALQSSTDRYGTIGLAFTYIGWLYVLSFCLLLSAVLGRAITRPWSLPDAAQVEGEHHLGEAHDQAADAGHQHQGAERQRGCDDEDGSGRDGDHDHDHEYGTLGAVGGNGRRHQGQPAEDPGGREDDCQHGQAGDQVPHAEQPGDQRQEADDAGQQVPADAATGGQERHDDPDQAGEQQPDAGERGHDPQREVRPDQHGEPERHRAQAGEQNGPPGEGQRA